jgi:hypothetical protein
VGTVFELEEESAFLELLWKVDRYGRITVAAL